METVRPRRFSQLLKLKKQVSFHVSATGPEHQASEESKAKWVRSGDLDTGFTKQASGKAGNGPNRKRGEKEGGGGKWRLGWGEGRLPEAW